MTVRDWRRQRPARVHVKPGQRWGTPDRRQMAIVTSISTYLRWGEEEIVVVSFLFYPGGGSGEAISETMRQAPFRQRFPVFID